jgi:pyruvate dehydrogenase E1 component
MRQMLEQQEDVFYYVTLMNENYAQPNLPPEAAADVIRGLYRYTVKAPLQAAAGKVRLLGSGAILPEVIAAAELLVQDWGVEAEAWSVTSYTELEREAREAERWNRLHPLDVPRVSHVAACLTAETPVVAASDYLRAVPQLIAPHIRAPYTVLGTDGFGRSDTRSALRDFFEVDRRHIALAALTALAAQGLVERRRCAEAMQRYGIAAEAPASWTC